jgi:hypothetical protein
MIHVETAALGCPGERSSTRFLRWPFPEFENRRGCAPRTAEGGCPYVSIVR